MPRVYFVKKARKDNPVVKKGESYYWWKHAFGPKKFSKERPKASQLTQSSYLSQLYALQEGLSDRFTDFDSLQDELQSLIDDLNQLGDECQDSLDSMPEHLQDSSSSGEMLQERIDAIEMATSEVIIQTPDQVDETPKPDFKLEQNYPNPFNPQTRILFSLPSSCRIQINVYDLRGMKVATIIQGFLEKVIHSTIWTGKDDSGKAVSSGTYFYRLTAGDYVETRRMTLVR